MNGIICIYKEKGMTSFDVVAKVRRIYKTKKVGHGGTLDPMAEGVLPVFVGDATKAVDFCPDDTKQYVAGFQFGITTDTQDITGKVLSTCDAYVSRNKMPMIERVFTGEQLQTPPMYSAVKVNGQRLYDLARKGEVVSRQPRKINIYELKVQKYEYNSGEMSVTCSKGTYIRTLIHDIGQKLETGAVMTSLIRVRSGVFTLDDCYRLRELEEKSAEELESLLLPLEKLYGQLPKARLDEKQTKLFRNGASLDADRIRFDIIYDKGYYIEGSDGVFLGLGKIGTNHELEVLRRFNTDSTNIMKPAPAENNYANIKTAVEKKAEKAKESFNTKAETDSDSLLAVETAEKTAEISEEAANIFGEAAAEMIEEATETPVETVTETVGEETEASSETAAETVEEVIETPAETVTETVEEATEALAEAVSETIKEEMEPPVEAVSETVGEVIETSAEPVTEIVGEEAETPAEAVSETIKEVMEPPAEIVMETVEQEAETPIETVSEKVYEAAEFSVETESVPQKNITAEAHEEPEQYDGDFYIPTLGYESNDKDGEGSIVAQALANIKAANGKFSDAEPDGAEDNSGKEVDIVEQAVARVTFDSELENIFSGISVSETAQEKPSELPNIQDRKQEQEQNQKQEQKRETDSQEGGAESRINIDNDYLAYLESAFIDDEEEFFDGERTDGI
ncbi:MAG: tRNA pseudouridine(55) synthase TruB [Ruminiclostridium sp.]|nr:tRNA pseudouridine(55) synthase TruB [Ruminiclostridium sp.]